MRESEERSRAILDALTAHITVVDRNGVILAINEAWERFGREHGVGSPHHTGVGANYLDACRKGAAGGNTEALDALIGLRSVLDGTREQFLMEYTIEWEGTQRWFLLNATPLKGSREGAVIAHTEITERKLAELRSRAAHEAAESAIGAKDRFLAALSHELRTPLAPALLMAGALEHDEAIPEQERGAIAMIRRNIELEARLIDDLLDYAKLGRGAMKMAREEIDAHALLRSAIGLPDAGDGRRQIIVELDAVRHHLHADPAWLQRVFRHLVGNAIRFTPEGGAITIRTDDAPDGRFRATITDTGIGFDAESAATIFEAFEGREERGPGGLGLGLGLARRIVEMHGGAITAWSAGRGRGATFTVELAAAENEAGGREEEEAKIVPVPEGTRVLVVEDHADTRNVLELMLRRWGCEVETAATMAEGIRATAGARFDLLISDIDLPDGNGRELLARIAPHGGLKAIAFSGFGTEEERRRSLEAGFLDHITKPVTPRKLLAVIARIIP
jgi:signal transduction histidine kinase/CheY-like chemotaxis protein